MNDDLKKVHDIYMSAGKKCREIEAELKAYEKIEEMSYQKQLTLSTALSNAETKLVEAKDNYLEIKNRVKK